MIVVAQRINLWASPSLRSGPALGLAAARPEAPLFPGRTGAGAALTSNDRFMGRFWRSQPGALRNGAPSRLTVAGARYDGWGRGACAEALSAELHSSSSNVGIGRSPAHEACAMLPPMLP